ncbi:MAG: M20/M25/M40 family metallo-hydrolase [Gemmatimonadetes bacterium]|jgi:carboxypeptidase Q|nr:M20/M25/M40 family metallo-hydrolase [Gemmatimonadota bacterium]MBK7835343.1 M20/M25/M40 family metallo-hydrolase [Gemmatimonadota bacterium]MBK8061735.1 M20/M25/M40 family metallo-hydrolase [Gemmatimonadota bacterium]
MPIVRFAARRHHRVLAAACAVALVALPLPAQSVASRYKAVADRIIAESMRDSAAWNRVALLTETHGHRLSGSPQLERAIDWIIARMKEDGLDNVKGEPVMVPRWVRGEESAEMILPRRAPLPMLGLGGSIGTPASGITAEVMVASSFADLEKRASEAKGKIVLFTFPWTNYGETGAYRRQGAIAAAKAGALASLIRSVTPYSMRTPHTGSMAYDTAVRKIPHAALAPEDADMIARMVARGEKVVVKLTMSAQTLPDVQSRNVMGEIRGSQFPDEVIVMGGHIDSWDVGRGAMDDAGGVVAAWEALRVLKRLGLTPKRTIRVVGWTNEENGMRGGNAYRDAHKAELDNHLLAIESDGGVFKPLGFGFTGPDAAFATLRDIGKLLDPIGAGQITKGGGGADIGPIMALGVPGMGLNVDDSRYFWFHHTDADTVDKLDPREVAQCVATLAVMTYIVADMPERLRPAGR